METSQLFQQLLTQYHATANHLIRNHDYALIIAANMGYIQTMEILMLYGANPNIAPDSDELGMVSNNSHNNYNWIIYYYYIL
jgi:ankyrin repeat protein